MFAAQQNKEETLRLFGVVAFMIFMLFPTWRIVTKAGYNGAWALIGLVPVVNIIMLWVFAFSTWPSERGPKLIDAG
jgi:hypothetical protein